MQWRWRPFLLLVPLLALAVGISTRVGTRTASVCNAELAQVSAEDAARSYASIDQLVSDFHAKNKNAVASWLVTPAFFGPEQVLLLADSDRWSAQLRFTDLNKPTAKGPEGKSLLASDTLSIPIEPQLAKRLVNLWQRVIRHPVVSRSSERIFDGTSYLVGVGDEWAYTYSPDCGLPGLFVRTQGQLQKAIRAGSESERAEHLTKLEGLLGEAERQLTTETTTN